MCAFVEAKDGRRVRGVTTVAPSTHLIESLSIIEAGRSESVSVNTRRQKRKRVRTIEAGRGESVAAQSSRQKQKRVSTIEVGRSESVSAN